METFLSGFIAAYREMYSCNPVLMQLIDKNFQIDTLQMDLSKAFHCIPHDILIAKVYAYDLSEKTTPFFYLYLQRTGQRVRMDDIQSSLQILISEVLQESIFGRILFNIILNDLLVVLKNSYIYNFTGDNTISVASKNRDMLLKTLKNEPESAVNWF